ncbi:MAG: TlyA family RNA methyltransferase [Elusimicrobiota bacterium]
MKDSKELLQNEHSQRKRLDTVLFEKKYAKSRGEAHLKIVGGSVLVNGKVCAKPGHKISGADSIVVQDNGIKSFVSRGGLKLDGALEEFNINLENNVCLDVGASTGGFTDCMLKRGAKKVYALDVGYGQLDWSLRNDPRVVCIEKTNIRYWDANEVIEHIDFATVDASFISLTKILPRLKEILKPPYRIFALIKPQFEVGPKKVKKGVVVDDKIREEAVSNIKMFCEDLKFDIKGICRSGIKGPKGNIEYFIFLENLEVRSRNSEES